MAPPGMPRTADGFVQPFNKAFENIKEGIKEALEGFNDLVAMVNEWAWLLGVATLFWIKLCLDEIAKHLNELIRMANHAIEHHIPVTSLMLTSFAWLDDVRSPVSNLSAKTVNPAEGNENLEHWRAEAQRAYDRKKKDQQDAIKAMSENAEFISAWLMKIAQANVDYAVKLANVLAEIAGAIVQAAIDASTVIDIPFAIDKLSNSVGKVAEAALKDLLNIANRFMAAVSNTRDLEGKMTDHSVFTDGHWPEAVAG